VANTPAQPASLPDEKIAVFRPIRQRKAAEEVVLVLADSIRTGIYAPGDRLPTVRELGQALEVSTGVVREAVEILRGAGIVSVRRGHSGGIVVENTAGLPQALLRAQGETQANMRALLQLRRPLEIAAAGLLAERATAADLEHLAALVEQLERLHERPDDAKGAERHERDVEFHNADAMFHHAMAQRTGNRVLAEALSTALDQILAAIYELPSGRVDADRAVHNQRKTLQAIASGERRRATKAMDEHVAGLEEALLGERLPFP
jgi:GntR family transcriptional repressor for pyruvate dehydrogenase complex